MADGDLKLNVIYDSSKGKHVVKPNGSSVGRNGDLSWEDVATAIDITFPPPDPFTAPDADIPIDGLSIPEGGTGVVTVENPAFTAGPYVYEIHEQSSGDIVQGEDDNDPTIIIED